MLGFPGAQSQKPRPPQKPAEAQGKENNDA